MFLTLPPFNLVTTETALLYEIFTLYFWLIHCSVSAGWAPRQAIITNRLRDGMNTSRKFPFGALNNILKNILSLISFDDFLFFTESTMMPSAIWVSKIEILWLISSAGASASSENPFCITRIISPAERPMPETLLKHPWLKDSRKQVKFMGDEYPEVLQ